MNVVEWRTSSFEESARELWPLIDGQPLMEVVEDYEFRAGFEPPGGYAGLVLEHYSFGDLGLYLRGEQRRWPGERVPLLGCDCGERGCWPLLVRVSSGVNTVTWDCFQQPHRPERQYEGFGPFIFDATSYAAAVESAVALAEA